MSDFLLAWAGNRAQVRPPDGALRIWPLIPGAVHPPRLAALPFLADRHRHLPAAGVDPGGEVDPKERAVASDLALSRTMFCDRVSDMGVGALLPWADRPAAVLSALRGLTGPHAGEHARRYAMPVGDAAAAIRAVVEQIAAGADHVKLIATGSGLAPEVDAIAPVMHADVLMAAIAAAEVAGVQVVAHSHGGPTADALIEARVAAIEHGLYLTDGQLARMAAQGVRLTLTPAVYVDADAQRLGPVMKRLVRSAVRAGTRVAVGTDGSTVPMLGQLQLLVELGFPFRPALDAAADWDGPVDDPEAFVRPLVLYAQDPAADHRRLEAPWGIALPVDVSGG